MGKKTTVGMGDRSRETREEIPLSGAALLDRGIVRVGETVRRPWMPWTASVHGVLVWRFVNSGNIGQGVFDLSGGLGPAKRPEVAVPMSGPAQDRLFQPPGAVKAATPDGLGSDQRKPALDQI